MKTLKPQWLISKFTEDTVILINLLFFQHHHTLLMNRLAFACISISLNVMVKQKGETYGTYQYKKTAKRIHETGLCSHGT